MSQEKQTHQAPREHRQPHTHDVDAGSEQQSPGRNEPHRDRDPEDRGGTYAREQREHEKPVHPQRYPREEVERQVPPPADPDDPAAT